MSVAKIVVRVGFGLSLALVGVAHYQDAAVFAEAVGRGLGPLESLGMMWGYVLPGLFIVGGVLLALGLYSSVGALLAGLGLVSIPAGLMLKSVLSGLSLNDTMPPAMNALVWLLVYLAAVRACHGRHDCCEPAKPPLALAKSSAPAKVTVSAPAKKMPIVKKGPSKKK